MTGITVCAVAAGNSLLIPLLGLGQAAHATCWAVIINCQNPFGLVCLLNSDLLTKQQWVYRNIANSHCCLGTVWLDRNLPTKQRQVQLLSWSEFFQTFKKELMPVLIKTFQGIHTEGTFPILFNDNVVTLTPKPERILEAKLQANHTHDYRCEKPNVTN